MLIKLGILHPLRLCEFLRLSFSVWFCVRSRKLAGRLLRAPRFAKQKNAWQKFTKPKRARYIYFFALLYLAGCAATGYQPVYIISQTPAEEGNEEPPQEKEELR